MNSVSGEERFWCHGCSKEITAVLDSLSDEYLCTECHSSFVEKVGQGVDSFLQISNEGNQNPLSEVVSPANTNDTNRNNSYSRPENWGEVVDALFGMGVRRSNNGVQIASSLNHIGINYQIPVRSRSDGLFGSGVPGQGMRMNSVSEISVEVPQGEFVSPMNLINSILQNIIGGPEMHYNVEVFPLSSISGLGAHNISSLGTYGDNMTEILHRILLSEQARGGHSTPATDEAIAKLESFVVTSETLNSDVFTRGKCCSISQEPFTEGDEVIVMDKCCQHAFCKDSLLTWLKTHNTCPVCRKIVE